LKLLEGIKVDVGGFFGSIHPQGWVPIETRPLRRAPHNDIYYDK